MHTSDHSHASRPPEPLAYGLLVLCRAGFEQDAGAELAQLAQRIGLTGDIIAQPGSAHVVLSAHEGVPLAELAPHFDWRSLIFGRQVLPWCSRVDALPDRDRATPIVAAVRATGQHFSALALEHPDSDAARPLAGFCRRFTAPLADSLERSNLLRPRRTQLPTLHVVFTEQSTAWLCAAQPDQAPPWPMGIPRLKMPHEAGSRSTLKLAEAFFTLLDAAERETLLRAGLRAVDLGAAPGGWTWQLAQRGLHVTAVDNGPMAASVMATGMVEHLRADGFVWRPKRPVEWLVCDMVEQPSRIATLVADWVATGRCRRAMFNLKLPMKKRLAAVEQCKLIIRKRLSAVGPYELRLRQLYHDREEITAYLTLRQ